jgi:hypothetical protein
MLVIAAALPNVDEDGAPTEEIGLALSRNREKRTWKSKPNSISDGAKFTANEKNQ